MLTPKTILVPVDFEPASRRALAYGRELARLFGAAVHVLHVVGDVFALSAGSEGTLDAFPQVQKHLEQTARAQLDDLMTDADRRSGARAVVVASSTTAQAIVSYADRAGADLIVMGTHGRSGSSAALIGSVAERVVRTASCPVLTVRASQRDPAVSQVQRAGG